MVFKPHEIKPFLALALRLQHEGRAIEAAGAAVRDDRVASAAGTGGKR